MIDLLKDVEEKLEKHSNKKGKAKKVVKVDRSSMNSDWLESHPEKK